ncbi:MAG: DEAD/DEAH box helicase, partial [Candidatus Bathyarchaeia archaeon]
MKDLDSDHKEIKEGKILEGPYWPERVKVISVKKIGANLEIQAVGVGTNRFYSGILGESDLQKIRVLDLRMRDFSGDAESFFLALEANRIRFAHQFDPLFAVNVSQINPLPHQIDGVYYHILKQPRIRFLLADDPGAGKTIMAGLVLKELKQRGIIERTLIVVPGHLIDQWRRELKEKFGETFRVVDRAVMDASWGRHVWQDDNQLITSIDFAKQEDVMQSINGVRWDLVIVDEAHKMAAYRYGEKLYKTERYELGKLLSRNSDFLLLLTATPHRGDPENFRLLLNFLEPDFFATTDMLEDSIRNKDNPLFLRRLKEDLHNFDGTPLFPPRHVKTIKYYLSDDEKRLYNAVTEYVKKYYQRAIDKDRRSVAFALIILQRRLASSVRAIRKSLERRINRLQELSKALEIGEMPKEPSYIDEEELEEQPEAERWKREDELSERLTSAETFDELKQEIDKLRELVRLAYEAEKKEVETKLNELRKVIESKRLKEIGVKLLIFTEFRDTLEYLVEKLKSWGFSVCYIHGAQKLDERIGAENEFEQTAQIMV